VPLPEHTRPPDHTRPPEHTGPPDHLPPHRGWLSRGQLYRGQRERPRRWRLRGRAVAVPLLVAALATASAPGLIRIQPGDTLWALARTHHTSVAAIQHANHLRSDTIYAGQLLRIPGAHASGGTAATTSTNGRTSTPGGWSGSHTVRAGDTVSGLAARYGTTVAALGSANHLSGSGLILVGQRLRVPGSAGRTSASNSAHQPLSTVDRHRALLASRPEPSKDWVRSVIVATARNYGVDASLALALAYQESGFQQAVVSGDDAIGVMQLLPGTAQWLSDDVAGRHLDPFDARDNITGGVLLLHTLLRVVPLPTAIGAYYQGLASIRARGMYDDTKQYVRNVLANRALFD